MGRLRVVVDPNVLISLLIGKRLSVLSRLFHEAKFQVIMDTLLLDELDGVAKRVKFRKYFPVDKVDELVHLLENSALIMEAPLKAPVRVSRDSADDYLLDLCTRAKAHVLLTGDEDLLVLKKHGRTRIQGPSEFIKEHFGG